MAAWIPAFCFESEPSRVVLEAVKWIKTEWSRQYPDWFAQIRNV
jgi:hypothetical protein